MENTCSVRILPAWSETDPPRSGVRSLLLLFLVVSDNPKAEKKDTFVEKLATQVIKNLQVKISSIHLRYEDDVSTDQGSGCNTHSFGVEEVSGQ